MCLQYDEKLTRELRAKLKANGGKLTCYKKLLFTGSLDLSFFYFCGPYMTHYVYKRGKNISGREENFLTPYEKLTQKVNDGIHVYTYRPPEEEFFPHIIIPCKVRIKDFVAAGRGGEAVFTSIYINKKDYKRAIQTCQTLLTTIGINKDEIPF